MVRKFAHFLVFTLLASAVVVEGAKKKKPKLVIPKPRQPLATKDQLKQSTFKKLVDHKRLNRREKKELGKVELQTYKQLRKNGFDEVGYTKEANMLRQYRLRNKKKKGILRKKESSIAQILFPGVSPEDYNPGEQIWILAGLVESKKTQVPFEVFDLPGFTERKESKWKKTRRTRRNLGSRLQGYDLKPAPFDLFVKKDLPCTPFSKVNIQGKKLRWLRKIIERQYRVNLQLDTLPVLMRSRELNFAVRGYPVGFKSPGGSKKELFLYNHFKFTITYHEDPMYFQGVRITGFDVHPVSIQHDIPNEKESMNGISTCTGYEVENDPSKFVALDVLHEGGVPVVFSYDVQWVENDLEWADRWDVYLIGSPDDDIHYYSIVNSLMVVLFMTGAIGTIMIRTLRKDISGYNELQALEEAQEDTGWKLVHGDVFRPPSFSPTMLSVLVGTGAQIGISVVLAILLSVMKITSTMKKGQMLTSLILLYVLCGSVAGYVSARIYKFTEAKAWKMNTMLTATALPGAFVAIFSLLNIFLSFAGAATAVNFLTILVLFLLWVCVSAPLVFIGAFIGLKAPTIEVSVKTKQIARVVPEYLWMGHPLSTMLMGGVLPFGSVTIELAFIMSALWLHQIYYVMGFLLAVIFILFATCAQVSIVLCYVQLCAEDHRWWWTSFWNCATAGVYLFLYSIWFLLSRLHLVGVLPVIVYLTYMTIISVCFALFCGSVGFLSSFWFTRTIYGAVKVD
jgi:transmembrane 9 superfamily protein 2/4